MAEIVEFELVAKTSGAVNSVNKVDEAVKKTGRSAKKTSKELSAFSEGGKQLVSSLDRMTGGLASKFVAVGKAAKLSGKAMKSALISSGIGLAVVAIGLIVEYWDEIGETLGFINKDLERQLELNKENKGIINSELSLLEKQIDFNKKRGISNAANLKQQKKLLEAKKVILDSDIRILETQILKAKVAARELSWYGKIKVAALENLGFYEKAAEIRAKAIANNDIDLEDQQKINALTGELNKLKIEGLNLDEKLDPVDESKDKVGDAAKLAEEAEKARIDAIERIRKGLIDTEAEERAEKLRLIKEDYDQQIALAAEFYGANSIKILELKAAQKLAVDEQQILFDEQDKERQNKKIEEQKQYDEKVLEDQKKLNEQLADAEVGLQEAKANALRGGLDVLGKLAGKSKALSAGLLVVEKGLAIAEVITNASKSILAAKANMAAVPAIIPGTILPNPSWAVQAAATLKGIATTKISAAASIATIAAQAIPGLAGGGGGGGSRSLGGGGDGGGGAPQAPAFNIVGASGETQLADAIGSQTQRPARAYVVSNDVTTAQEMDRNIIEGASIG